MENEVKLNTMRQETPKNLILKHVKIVYPYFNGEEAPMNRAGDRNFKAVIEDPDIAREIAEEGYYVAPYGENRWKIKIKLGTNFPSPSANPDFNEVAYMVTDDGQRTKLDKDQFIDSDFSRARIKYVDIEAKPYDNERAAKRRGQSMLGTVKWTAYAKTLYIYLEDDALGDPFAGDFVGGSTDDDDLPF